MTGTEVLNLVFLGSGIFIVLLGIPMSLKKIPQNGLYGFRVRKTLDNEEAWYAVNKALGDGFIIGGAIFTIVSAILFFYGKGISEDMTGYIGLGVCAVTIGGALIYSIAVLKRY